MYHPQNPYRGLTPEEQINLRYNIRTPKEQVEMFMGGIGSIDNVIRITETNEGFEFIIKDFEKTKFPGGTEFVERYDANKEPVGYRAISGGFVMQIKDEGKNKSCIEAISCVGEINEELREVLKIGEKLNGELE